MGVKTLKTISNDFVYSDGRLEVLTGVEALAQITENRLKLWLGEWFLAPNEGIDYLGLFNQRQFLKERFTAVVRAQVLADTRIKKIININIDFDNSTREINMVINLEADEGTFEVTI